MSRAGAQSVSQTAGRLLALLVVVVAILAGFRWLVSPDYTLRNFEYFPEMATSLAVESQSPAAQLPEGLAQQRLVAGVVARGRRPFRFGADDAEAQRAGRELTSLIAAGDTAAAERGAEVYRIHCTPCHDATGGGQGPAVLRGMQAPPPMQGASAVAMPDGQMFHVLTLGRGYMPAMGARLEPHDRWCVIRHVRALQGGAGE